MIVRISCDAPRRHDTLKHRGRFILLAACVAVASYLIGQPRAIAAPHQPSQNVQLPYAMQDSFGSNWDVQADGSIGDGGNNLFDGGAHLQVNGQQFQGAGTPAVFSPSRNELVVAGVQMNGLNVTRRVAVNKASSWARYTEVFQNPTAAAVHVEMRENFSIGFPPQAYSPYVDPKKKDRPIGVALSNNNNALGIVAAGRGAKLAPQMTGGASVKEVNLSYVFDVSPHQTASIIYLLVRRPNVDAAMQAISTTKDKDYLAGIDSTIAHTVLNFNHGDKTIGDEEILRGDISDIVELRGGDQYKGTIKNERFKLATDYGPIELPAEQVVGMLNVGRFKPRQQFITTEGEIYGGLLADTAINLEMSNGQTTSIPLSQVARLGYHIRPNEPEEWTFSRPMIVLRTGERMIVAPPTDDLEVLSRYGELKIKPSRLQAVVLQSEDSGANEIRLADGSHFTGLLEGADLPLTLGETGGGLKVTFPLRAISRLQVSAAKPEEEDDDRATFSLANDDLLVGSLAGDVKVQTAFDTITLAGAQIAHLGHLDGGGPLDVLAILWDNSTVSGQLSSPDLHCQLQCGGDIVVPIGLLQDYDQPLPQPSAPMIVKIKAAVADLAAEDWRQRDRAEATLTSMGIPVAGVLRDLRESQSPEAQQRIDSILKKVTEKHAVASPPTAENLKTNIEELPR